MAGDPEGKDDDSALSWRSQRIHRFPGPVSLNTEMPRIWRQEYLKDRYLLSRSIEYLEDRMCDIFDNVMVLDWDTRKYKPEVNIREGIYHSLPSLDFLRMMMETYFEGELRGKKILKANNKRKLIDAEKILLDQKWAVRSELRQNNIDFATNYQRPKTIFRFSNKRYNESLFREGTLRFAPSMAYRDDALLPAQFDNENQVHVSNGGYYELDAEFWICSFSCIYELRMYAEFEANSCIVIRDVPEFENRVVRSVHEFNAASPDDKIAQANFSPVVYYDPCKLFDVQTINEFHFLKPFRYAYQREFRAILAPKKNRPSTPIFLNLGPLTDIAELISA
ncbi:hypothetical protein [Mesorhizobium sp.]|uniref:hypothetical protein n=1 Tax=Mesorhizobium sp. TaxID=1871066 RepID=UPI000FE9A8FA|nr:hypothetical protein [Mesorhizobium sp.]RWD65291.1 MAG: hypothetical protein EOS37_26240 [Mesorhizobium sp.]